MEVISIEDIDLSPLLVAAWLLAAWLLSVLAVLSRLADEAQFLGNVQILAQQTYDRLQI